MRLQSLKARNFLSFGEPGIDLPFEDFNTIVGRNNSGKTNVLRALTFVGDLIRNSRLGTTPFYHRGNFGRVSRSKGEAALPEWLRKFEGRDVQPRGVGVQDILMGRDAIGGPPRGRPFTSPSLPPHLGERFRLQLLEASGGDPAIAIGSTEELHRDLLARGSPDLPLVKLHILIGS